MYDILIVGSGPAGLAAAIYGKRANLSVAVIEKNFGGVGQIGEGGHVYNYPGLPGIRGFELGMKFSEHAAELSVEFIEQEMMSVKRVCGENGQASKIVSGDDRTLPRYEIQLKDGSVRESLAVVYAAGTSPKKTGLPEEEKFIAKGISYCAICDAAFYRNKDVAVLGNGEYAIGEIEELLPVAKSVTMLTDGKEYVENRSNNEKLKINNKKIREFRGDNKIEEITFEDNSTEKVNGIFIAQGTASSLDFAKKLGARIEENHIIVNNDMETTLPNVYAAGDCTGGILQISKAVYEGTKAGLSIINKLRRKI